MGHVFPEIRAKQEHVEEVIQREEEAFNKTLDRGIELFNNTLIELGDTKIKARDLERKLQRARERISKLPDARPTKSNRLARLKNEVNAEVLEIIDISEDERSGKIAADTLFEGPSSVLKAVNPLFRLIIRAAREEDSDEAYSALLRNYEEKTIEAQAELLRIANERPAISGRAAFVLYDTYGFPLDLTELMARERGLTVDVAGFEALMNQQKERARKAQKKEVIELSQIETDASTSFVGYEKMETPAKVLEVVGVKDKTAVILDTSPFYAEMGGQVGDTGELAAGGQLWRIVNTQKAGAAWLHFLAEDGVRNTPHEDLLTTGSTATLTVDRARRNAIQRHHTVTHLLHWALHEVVSPDATQKGSYVGPDKLTFDFSSAALTPQQVADVERLVNERILDNAPVTWVEVKYSHIKDRKDIMQFFGEKYGEWVRVVQIGGQRTTLNGYSMELCGGTHVRAAGEIGLFRISAESAIAAGIRRIEAVSGLEAYKLANEQLQLIRTVAGKVNSPVGELEKKIEALLAQQKELEKRVKSMQQKQAVDVARSLTSKAQNLGTLNAIVENLGVGDGDFLQTVADALKGQFKGAVVLGSHANGAVALLCTVSPELTSMVQAGKIIQAIAPVVGGKGGGRPDTARGGGKEISKLDEALARARELLKATA
jgi:alanyl-tRNA synthetase